MFFIQSLVVVAVVVNFETLWSRLGILLTSVSHLLLLQVTGFSMSVVDLLGVVKSQWVECGSV